MYMSRVHIPFQTPVPSRKCCSAPLRHARLLTAGSLPHPLHTVLSLQDSVPSPQVFGSSAVLGELNMHIKAGEGEAKTVSNLLREGMFPLMSAAFPSVSRTAFSLPYLCLCSFATRPHLDKRHLPVARARRSEPSRLLIPHTS